MWSVCGRKEETRYIPVSAEIELPKVEKESWKWSTVVAKFWIICIVLVVLLYFFDYFELESLSVKTISTSMVKTLTVLKEPEVPKALAGYLIKTPGCTIPEMDPFDSSVKRFIDKPHPKICNHGLPPLFESNFTSIYMVKSALSLYKSRNNITNIICCFQEFWRVNPKGSSRDFQVRYDKTCTPILGNETEISREFIKVTCKGNGIKPAKVYEDYFAFVPDKKENRLENSMDISMPSILIIGLDAVSRVNLHRQLPKTWKYLASDLEAIELLGYNKVADNTFPNLIPVFTGMFEKELKETCWPKSDSRFDKCPFIWKNFSLNNYVTAIGEDCGWIGVFNYLKKGFQNQTSDYYFTNFEAEMEGHIGSVKDFNCDQCVGGRHTYKVLLEYVRKFVVRMKIQSTPYFGFFWGNSLSHDYLNRPALGDETYYNLFKYFKEDGHLNNTILIFMSDHGIRWGNIRKTFQGQMEERLPFVVMVLPKWFRDKYTDAFMNLKKNVRRLTTPFDLYETLKDLLNVPNLDGVENNSLETTSRGYSLFKAIPKNRTCNDAEIESHWCTCQRSIEINMTDEVVRSAADFAVYHINSQLEGYADCAKLDLDSIINARLLTHEHENITPNKAIRDYTIILKTTPGEAVFEVTVRQRHDEIRKRSVAVPAKWKKFNITGTISRLNLYGYQSYCITDFHLKLYCFCKTLIKKTVK